MKTNLNPTKPAQPTTAKPLKTSVADSKPDKSSRPVGTEFERNGNKYKVVIKDGRRVEQYVAKGRKKKEETKSSRDKTPKQQGSVRVKKLTPVKAPSSKGRVIDDNDLHETRSRATTEDINGFSLGDTSKQTRGGNQVLWSKNGRNYTREVGLTPNQLGQRLGVWTIINSIEDIVDDKESDKLNADKQVKDRTDHFDASHKNGAFYLQEDAKGPDSISTPLFGALVNFQVNRDKIDKQTWQSIGSNCFSVNGPYNEHIDDSLMEQCFSSESKAASSLKTFEAIESNMNNIKKRLRALDRTPLGESINFSAIADTFEARFNNLSRRISIDPMVKQAKRTQQLKSKK